MFDIYTYEMIRRRAAGATYQRFRISHECIWFLSALMGYLQSQGRDIISEIEFVDTYTGNSKKKGRLYFYLTILKKEGYISTVEYISRPGSLSLGFTTAGLNLLKFYRMEVAKLAAKYAQKEGREVVMYELSESYYHYRPIIRQYA